MTRARASAGAGAEGSETGHSLLGSEIDLADGRCRWFGRTFTGADPGFLAEHRLADVPVLPAAAMLEWAIAAVRASGADGSDAWALERVGFNAFLHFADERPVDVQAGVEVEGDVRRVRCFGRPAGGRRGRWSEYVTVGAASPAGARPGRAEIDPEGLRERTGAGDSEAVYARFREFGVVHGPAFRGLRELWRDGDRVLGRIEVGDTGGTSGPGDRNVLVLDACFHAGAAAFDESGGALWLPSGVDRLVVHGDLPARVWCRVRRRDTGDAGERALDLEVLSDGGDPLVTVEGLRLRTVPDEVVAELSGVRPRRYEIGWLPVGGRGSAAGAQGTWLVCGTDSAQVAEWRDALDAVVVDGDEESFARVRASDAAVRGLILLGGASGKSGPDGAYELAEHAFTALKHYLRAYAGDRPEVVVCSRGAVAVGGADAAPDPAQAVLTGAVRAVVSEYPDVRCVQADLDPAAPAAPARVLARVADLPGSGHLAERGGAWFEARLRESAGGGEPALKVRRDGTYLVTGGLGGLGLAVAERLAADGAGALLLAGRTVPAEVPARIAELRERGVRVELRGADVADPDQVAGLLRFARAELPPLRGVVHAAGVTADAPLEDSAWPDFARVLDPKVRGAWHLHRGVEGDDLDFFVLFSSLASLLGSAGQASYIAANAFMDALAVHRRRAGLPAVSVGWGPWAETGMVAARGLGDRLGAMGVAALPTGRALDALAEVPSGAAPHVGVAAVDWRRYLAATRGAHPDTLLSDVAPADVAEAAPPAPERLAELTLLALDDPDAAREAVLGELLDRVAALLGMSAADRERGVGWFAGTRLNVLGLDSLTTMRLRRGLDADLAVDVPAELLLGGGTAAEIAAEVCRQLTVRGVLAGGDAEDGADDGTEVLTL
ncbi:type I polyketide synthase [Actinomadura sp. WMMB 499]|uniref:type I polyketide synthase n=1 Tax=Actinomadura sp. WMMB 499 TaxID=1219491 RepID=UPI001243B6DA|nr:type I polyketide synthase [Actinomadura sp. WMMB 499]QFG24788.1 SDR family NAD(P)-dependent oxidoreductase [Actinomadura sp. WMMB 499]